MVKYPPSYARMRGLKGKLIGQAQLESFLGTSDTGAITSVLGQTAYGDHLRDATSIPWIEHGLKQDLVECYVKILVFLRGRAGRFVEALLRKFELLNLKSIVRSFVHGSIIEEPVQSFIFSLGKYHTIPIQEALKADDLESLIALMERTPFSRPLEIGYQQYESAGRIFPLELALDLDYYERLWEALDALGPFDKHSASRLMGIQYDITNLVWIFRFKEYYGFSPEQIYQYIIPHGLRIHGDVFREIAASDDVVESVVNLRVKPYDDLLRSVPRVDNSFILGAELDLLRYFYRESLKIFMKFPFQAAQLIAFFVCKEMEIKDIITILSGKHLGLSQERIRSYMITL
jgi:V/A-type H+-transporting ATPase subunit C